MPKAPVMFEVIESHPGMYHCCMCGKTRNPQMLASPPATSTLCSAPTVASRCAKAA
jgi:hypothetical protein